MDCILELVMCIQLIHIIIHTRITQKILLGGGGGGAYGQKHKRKYSVEAKKS
jgi:hypothetical protein